MLEERAPHIVRVEMQAQHGRNVREIGRGSTRTRALGEPKISFGRAITQTISHRLPTMAAQVRAWVRSCGNCDGQSGTGAGFLRVL
jgi:hypothetical protein